MKGNSCRMGRLGWFALALSRPLRPDVAAKFCSTPLHLPMLFATICAIFPFGRITGMRGRPLALSGGKKFPPLLFIRTMTRKTLSIFVDESGKLLYPDSQSRFYIVGMVFHDQAFDVSILSWPTHIQARYLTPHQGQRTDGRHLA